MATRFRKSKKILPGVKVNLNKKSASVTIGPKWLHTTYSTTGKKTTTASIPGTGIYSSTSSPIKKTDAGTAAPVGTIAEQEPVISPKSRAIALVLCIFTVCGHRFYTKKFGSAILYLFTVGLFAIGWIYDIVKICTGKFTDKDGAYIQEWNTKSTPVFLIVFAILIVLGAVLSRLGIIQ